jgi:hypothetical protein
MEHIAAEIDKRHLERQGVGRGILHDLEIRNGEIGGIGGTAGTA